MMKKIFLFSLLLTSVVFAQLPTRPVFPAGNGTNEKFFRVGKTAPYFSWETTKHKYFYIDSTVTPHDTLWWEGVKLSKDYTWTGKHTFKNVTTFDSTMYLANNQFFSSKVFVPGWGGSGWKLDYGLTNAARSSLEFDDLTVRGRLSVYELLIRQIRATNGAVFVTASAKVASVSGTTVTFEDASYTGGTYLCPFAAGDLLMVQKFRPDGTTVIKLAKATVSSVSSASAVVVWDVGTFAKGDEVVRIGNTTDASRQNSIYLTSDDSNSPFMDMTTGVNSWTAWDAAAKTKLRIGNLAGITDSDFGGALSGNGLYGQNVYLKGKLKIASNADIIGLSANVTITAITAPTTRTDGTALVAGDLWIDSDGLNYRYRWNGTSWVDMNIPYVSTPSGTGLFIDGTHMGYYTAGAWQTYIDNTGKYYFTGDANNYISWNGTTQTIKGNIIITGGSGIGSLTDANLDHIGDGASYVRTTPTEKTGAGRAYTGLDSSNRLITAVIPATAVTPSGAGLYLGSNYMGYYSGLAWTTHMDNSGNFYLGGTSGALGWNAGTSTLTINGSLFTNTVTVGTAVTDGYIQSYGWNGTANGFQIKGGATPSVSLIGGTITGGTIQTATSGQRIVLNSSLQRLIFYDSGGSSNYFDSFANVLRVSGDLYSNGAIGAAGSLYNAGGNFNVNSSGQIIKVNNISPTAKYTLIGDGTSFTPRLLAMSDLPALTANRVLLSDASGYVAASSVSNTTLGYLDATSSVQTQLNSKASLTADNTLSGENSFAKLKFNAEVSHSVTGSGNYSCLDKNVIILTPNASGYIISLTDLSPNRPVLVLNASGSYTVTVSSTSGGKLLPVYGMAWMVYNVTSATTFIQ